MNIQTEATPNPSSLKFLPGKTVMEKETADFRNVEEAKFSPFALNLFKIDGVEGVFFGSDFISITKADNHDWQYLESTIIETLENVINQKLLSYLLVKIMQVIQVLPKIRKQ